MCYTLNEVISLLWLFEVMCVGITQAVCLAMNWVETRTLGASVGD